MCAVSCGLPILREAIVGLALRPEIKFKFDNQDFGKDLSNFTSLSGRVTCLVMGLGMLLSSVIFPIIRAIGLARADLSTYKYPNDSKTWKTIDIIASIVLSPLLAIAKAIHFFVAALIHPKIAFIGIADNSESKVAEAGAQVKEGGENPILSSSSPGLSTDTHLSLSGAVPARTVQAAP